MARRPLLTDEERRLLFGIPDDPDILAQHYTFTRSDQDLVAGRRGVGQLTGFCRTAGVDNGKETLTIVPSSPLTDSMSCQANANPRPGPPGRCTVLLDGLS